jgi:mannose-6-phosphate isomerase-like protein (cupin superfamily)
MNSASPAPPGAQILHGGAERLPLRWLNIEEPPARISRYRVASGASVSLHVHTGKAEYWVILSGHGVVRVGATSIPVAEGDIVVTPPSVPHGLINTGSADLTFLNIVQPTGDEITSVEVAG